MRRAAAVFFAAWCLSAAPAHAHEVRPAYLELVQTAADTYDVVWKVPALGDQRRLAIRVRFPPGTETVSGPHGEFGGGAFVERRSIRRAGGLAGQDIEIAGLESTMIDVLVRVEHLGGASSVHRVLPASPSFTLETQTSGWQGARLYLRLGIEHILQGIDHLLFVLGLLLIVPRRRALVKTITAFTIAHSITLAVATLGYAHAPVEPLNAAIALSILFLGPEIVRYRRGETTFTIRHPWVVAFAFGLLHGFGFAGGLALTGLPQPSIPFALLLFNIGVEIGQLGFVLVILAMTRAFAALGFRWPEPVGALPGYAVGTLGAFWTIQRVAVMLGVVR